MIKFRLHMIPPSKKPWIARNRNQLAWMFPRESSTMERSPLCSATPTSVSKSNLWALWQLLEHRIKYHNSSYTMLYAATHALFTICPWLWLTLTKTSFREEWYCKKMERLFPPTPADRKRERVREKKRLHHCDLRQKVSVSFLLGGLVGWKMLQKDRKPEMSRF